MQSAVVTSITCYIRTAIRICSYIHIICSSSIVFVLYIWLIIWGTHQATYMYICIYVYMYIYIISYIIIIIYIQMCMDARADGLVSSLTSQACSMVHIKRKMRESSCKRNNSNKRNNGSCPLISYGGWAAVCIPTFADNSQLLARTTPFHEGCNTR